MSSYLLQLNQQNCSILVCEETKKAAVADPGGDLDKIEAALQQLGVEQEKVFITHGPRSTFGQERDADKRFA